MLKYPSINHNKPQKWDNYGNNRSLTPLGWRAWKSSMRWWLAPGFLELEITVPRRKKADPGKISAVKTVCRYIYQFVSPFVYYIYIYYNLLSISICHCLSFFIIYIYICHCLSLFIIYDIDLPSFTYVLSIYCMDFTDHFAGNIEWRWPELCGCIESSWFRQGCSWSRTILGTWPPGDPMVMRCSHFVQNLRATLWWTYKKLWKITIFNGKIQYKWPFSIAMLVHQRIHHVQSLMFCEKTWKKHRLLSIVILTHGCSSYYLVGGSFGRIIIPVLKWRPPSYGL